MNNDPRNPLEDMSSSEIADINRRLEDADKKWDAISNDLRPCRDAFEEWWWDEYGDSLFNKAWGQRIWEAACNRRSGDGDGAKVRRGWAKMYRKSIVDRNRFVNDVSEALREFEPDVRGYLPNKILRLVRQYAALRARVGRVRDEMNKESKRTYEISQNEYNSRELQKRFASICIVYGKIRTALTRILDEDGGGRASDTVTARVGASPVPKSTTITPDS